LNYLQIKSQKLLKTLDNYVLEKKVEFILIKEVHSIDLLLISWLKEEISLNKMVLVEYLFMEINLLMKTLLLNIKEVVY